MAYLASQLITNAYYISGIVSRDLETVSGSQMTDGLSYLNAIISFKSTDARLIPYFQQYTTNLVPNQEAYFIPNLIEVETVTFNLNNLRYEMERKSRRKYWGTGRVNNISSLPFSWEFERGVGGATIYVYFLPISNYLLTVWGKFGLTAVASTSTDLTQYYDLYYIDYLKFATAEYICIENNIEMQPQAAAKLKEYMSKLIDVSPIDMSIRKLSTLSAVPGLNWGDINAGLGWRPY